MMGSVVPGETEQLRCGFVGGHICYCGSKSHPKKGAGVKLLGCERAGGVERCAFGGIRVVLPAQEYTLPRPVGRVGKTMPGVAEAMAVGVKHGLPGQGIFFDLAVEVVQVVSDQEQDAVSVRHDLAP